MASITSTVQTITEAVTAAPATALTFFSDRLHLPELVRTRMAAKKWKCDTHPLPDFYNLGVKDFHCAAILLDASDVHLIDSKRLEDKIRELDNANIPVILLSCPITLESGAFRLTSKIRSANVEELWARIEMAIRYARTLYQTDLIDQQQRHLEEQLRMAGAVQKNFLPQMLPQTPLVRFGCIYHPAEWVSGDIYDATRLDEDHIAFYIADAVGHSMPAALLTMFLKHTAVLRQTQGDKYHIYTPQQVLDNINCKMLDQQLKGCLFATACCCLLDTATMQLFFARAGHPYPILIRSGQAPILLQSRGGLLGVFDTMSFEQAAVSLAPGDKILLYSDGIEPLLGETGQDGVFQFSDSFLKICEMPLISMLETIENTVTGWQRTSAEKDDVTLLGMEIA